MSLEAMYQDVILDSYKNPANKGLRDGYDAEVHHVNPSCGDEVTLRVHLAKDGTIKDISYDGEGCSISQASTSIMTEEIIGLRVEDAMHKLAAFEEMVTSQGAVAGDPDVIGDAVAFGGVAKFPARVKCALLGWKAFQAATVEALNENGSSAQDSVTDTVVDEKKRTER